MPQIQVESGGIRRLLERLESERLLRRPLRKLFAALGRRGRDEGRSIAPRATGRLASKMTYKTGGRAIPNVSIQAKARNRDFPYPRLLNFSPKHGHLGWLTDAMEALMDRITPELDDAARDIEQEFSGNATSGGRDD